MSHSVRRQSATTRRSGTLTRGSPDTPAEIRREEYRCTDAFISQILHISPFLRQQATCGQYTMFIVNNQVRYGIALILPGTI